MENGDCDNTVPNVSGYHIYYDPVKFTPMLDKWRRGTPISKLCYGLNNEHMKALEELDSLIKYGRPNDRIKADGARSKSIALDCALGAQEVWGYGEDNDGWYVSCNDKQIAWAASENYAKRIAERMNARIMMTLARSRKKTR